MKKILVTGGSGYIGSHTLVDLIENGFEVISADNNSRSTIGMLEGVEKITGTKVKNYKVDLCNFDETRAIFEENDNSSYLPVNLLLVFFYDRRKCLFPLLGILEQPDQFIIVQLG